MTIKKVAALLFALVMCLGMGIGYAEEMPDIEESVNQALTDFHFGWWERDGSIHLTPACWDVYMAPDGGAAGIYMGINWFYLQNRDDNPISYHIDFHDWQGEVIARIPEEGERELNGHAGTRVSPTNELELPVNTWLSPVVIWSGRVRVTPTCVAKIQFFDIDGKFVHSEIGVGYDDSVR